MHLHTSRCPNANLQMFIYRIPIVDFGEDGKLGTDKRTKNPEGNEKQPFTNFHLSIRNSISQGQRIQVMCSINVGLTLFATK